MNYNSKIQISTSALAAISLGMALITIPVSSRVQAVEPSRSVADRNALSDQSVPTTNVPNAQAQAASQNNSRRDDSVDVEDVYPEYCRVFFPPHGSVTLLEYQEKMQRCIYGIDRAE